MTRVTFFIAFFIALGCTAIVCGVRIFVIAAEIRSLCREIRDLFGQ